MTKQNEMKTVANVKNKEECALGHLHLPYLRKRDCHHESYDIRFPVNIYKLLYYVYSNEASFYVSQIC